MLSDDLNQPLLFATRCRCDVTKSAIWAAQRVPDDHVSVVANQFIMKEVSVSRKEKSGCDVNPKRFFGMMVLEKNDEYSSLWRA